MLTRILFLDIETVSRYSKFEELSDKMKSLWNQKVQHTPNPQQLSVADLYERKAAIYAEFGKIICISVGAYYWKRGELLFKTKSFSGFKEEKILCEFSKLLTTNYSEKNQYLCGHNIKEFDIPYICRRMLVHGIKLPTMLDIRGRKPWELHHLLDTMNQWKFGDYKHFTSLDLLCELFGIHSPKSDISGSKVGNIYWNAADLLKIQAYCEADVCAVAQLFKKLNQITYAPSIESTLHRAS